MARSDPDENIAVADASAAATRADPAAAASRLARIKHLMLSERADAVGLGVALVALVVFFSIRSPYFLSTANFSAIGVAIAVFGIIAAVQTIVLICGELDLSITAVYALAGIVTVKASDAGAPSVIALLAGIGTGVAAGSLNAAVVVGIGVNALIATIGTQFVIRGVALITTQGQNEAFNPNAVFTFLANGDVAGIAFPIVLSVGVFLLVGGAMRFTRFGSRVYATGGSENAARLAGISIWRLRTLVYVLSGISAGIGGILLASQGGGAFPQAGIGSELTIIGAVVLGGTALGGGRGTALGTALGILLLGVLQNGLNLLGVEAFWQTFIQGIILVAAVCLDELRRRWRNR